MFDVTPIFISTKKILFLILFYPLLGFSQNKLTTTKCKIQDNDRIRKNCIINEVKKYVEANFNPDQALDNANIGYNKIYAHFTINMNAKILDVKVKAKSHKAEIEAIRVIKSFPSFIPAKNGYSEGISSAISSTESYNFLIEFMVDHSKLALPNQRILDKKDKQGYMGF